MPTIKLLKERKRRVNNQEHNKSLAYSLVYNTTKWRKLRLVKLQNCPLCEECLKEGKVSPAVEIHHIKAILDGDSEDEMVERGFNYDNLESLCEECHHKIHNLKRKQYEQNNFEQQDKEE